MYLLFIYIHGNFVSHIIILNIYILHHKQINVKINTCKQFEKEVRNIRNKLSSLINQVLTTNVLYVAN